MPKQKSLYIYDPLVVYAHELYSFNVSKNRKLLPPKPEEINTVSSIILNYSKVMLTLIDK